MITGHDGVKKWRGIVAIVALLLGVAVLASAPSMGLAAMGAPNNGGAGAASTGGKDPLTSAAGPIVGRAEHADTSPPLRSIRAVVPDQPDLKAHEENENPLLPSAGDGRGVVDSIVQKITNPLAMPTPRANFDGMYNVWGPVPPDTNGDVGP